jgi:hypothetical protein
MHDSRDTDDVRTQENRSRVTDRHQMSSMMTETGIQSPGTVARTLVFESGEETRKMPPEDWAFEQRGSRRRPAEDA